MQKLNQEIDLGGHKVFVGSRVNVRWKGEWYDGKVLKLGPKRNLCRIRDLSSNQNLLLEPHQIKLTRTHGLDKRLLPGNHVAYNNGEKWLEGVIVTSSAVGVVQVSWRNSVRAAEAQNWFEIVDVAPVAQDQTYLEQSKEELAASRSGLLPNDAVEPHPRTMENALFDPNDDEGEEERGRDIIDHFSRARRTPAHHSDNTNGFPMSPTYEDIDEEIQRANRTKARPLPSPPVDQITDSLADPWMSESLNFSPTHSIPPSALSMVYPHVTPYGSTAVWGEEANATHHHHPVHSFHIPHPKPASDRNLERSTLPCALSYQLSYHNGIPPHHSSNFFKQMKRTVALPSQMSRGSQVSDGDIYGHSLMRPSPSILSKALSEPLSSTLQVIPRRERKRNRLFSGKKKQSKKNMKQKAQPLPYEIPSRILEVVAESESTKGDLTEMETEAVSRPQTSTPKKKKKSPGAPPVIASASASLLSVNMGENILITCIATSKASVTYTWYKDGVKLPGAASNIEQLSPGKLEIQKAQHEDEGMYRCVAKNKYGSETRYFQLNVTMEYKVPMKMVRRSPHRTKHSKKSKPKPEEPIITSITIPGEDMEVKKFLDDLVEDIKIPDVEFAVGKPENDEDAMEAEIGGVPDDQSNGQETMEINSIEDDDQLTDIPEIVGASERKKALRRVSIGNKAVGEMDLYLGGYGEDYGSRSSTTDLEQEGLRYYKEREIKKSLAARDKEKEKQSRDNSPTDKKMEEENAPVAFKHKSRRLLNFSKFTRKNKKTSQVADQPVASAQPQESTSIKPAPAIVIEAVHINGEREEGNSIAVNTSLGGTDSDDTVVDEAAADKGHVHLPLESVSVSDRVRLLQESVKEHHPDDIIAEASRRKGFFSGIFSKGKNSTKTSV